MIRGPYRDTGLSIIDSRLEKNAKKIEEYIKNQLQEDIMTDQLSLFETTDPFTGEKYKKK